MNSIFDESDTKQIVTDTNLVLAFEVFKNLKKKVGQEGVDLLIKLMSQGNIEEANKFLEDNHIDFKKLTKKSIKSVSDNLTEEAVN